jgi:DNA-binding PadR family transcriptional regulator
MALRGHLKVLVYKALSDKPMSGYALMNLIAEKTGSRPSAGSIYPLLDSLATEGVLTFRETANKKVYSLTAEGKKEAKNIVEKRDALLKELKELVRMLGILQGEDMAYYIDSIEQQLKGMVPFGVLHDDIEELRTHLFKLNALGHMQKKAAVIRKILRRANNDFKKIA